MRGPTPGFRGHLATAIIGIAAGLAVFFYLFINGGGADFGSKYHVNALVPTANTLTPGARVTMAGAKVGRVAKVTRHGIGTEIKLDITDKNVTPIPVDSRITLRQRTPVGENYISIQPGTSKRMLPDNGVLTPDHSDEYVDVDQILSVVRGSARERTRALIQAMGGPLRGRGENLNRIVHGGGESLTSGARLLKLLSGDKEQVASLVQRLGSVSGAVEQSSAQVATIATKGLRSMQAVASRDDALRRTLDELPGALAQVRTTSGKLNSVTGVATPVVANLAAAMRDVRPAVHALRPAAQDGREVVGALGVAAPKLNGTLRRTQALSGPLVAALPALHKTVCNINPIVRYGKPYTQDVNAAVIGLGSASNSYDAIGHLIRLSPIISENTLVGLPESVSRAAHVLLRSGFLSKVNGLTWNPYPKPGMIGKDQAGPGNTVFGPADLEKAGYKYPHILSDC